MFGNLIYFFTTIAYAAIVAITLFPTHATGERRIGWGFIVLGVLVAYVLCSLMLTINIALKGKFDWISDSKALKNSIIAVGWLCLMAGVVYPVMVNEDWRTPNTANWLGLIFVKYAAVWIPLLMLVPYAIILNTEWSNTFSLNFYKIPLLVGCVLGLVLPPMYRSPLSDLFKDNKAISELKYQETMRSIGYEDEVSELLYYYNYKGEEDERIKDAALTKLKKHENLEAELLNILKNYESSYDYIRVYTFWENNRIEHPQLFVEPLKKIVERVTQELHYRLDSFSSENGFLELLNVDGLCRVLETQFKQYKEEFRPYMLKMQEKLDREPKPNFIEMRNKYRAVVKNWLDLN